jgi:hypothetical protein
MLPELMGIDGLKQGGCGAATRATALSECARC